MRRSVLAGLAPAVIFEIASRALNFHTYQANQEASFQAAVARKASERIAVLEGAIKALAASA